MAEPPDRHHQGIGNELRRHRCTHRPADHPPGKQIDHGSHIEPTFCCPHISEVGDPFAIGSRRLEAALEHVRSDGGDLPLTQIVRQSTPSRTGFEGSRINRSIRCRPQGMPSASMSCHTRLAP